jgi:chromosome segregation ATPase
MSEQTMGEPDGFWGWILSGVATIIATLTTAVASLYKSQIGDLKAQLVEAREASKAATADHRSELSRLDQVENELRKEIADCKADREDLRVCLAKQQVELELIKARVAAVEKQ